MTTSNARSTIAPNPKPTFIHNSRTLPQLYAAIAALGYHNQKTCIMCSDEPQKDQQIQFMEQTAFIWHLNSLFESNGQSLNGETLREMYKKYQEIIKNLRRTSNEMKTGHSYRITVGVLT